MQIETTEQLKQEFSLTLSRLSHEIRNPISLINSELQLMALIRNYAVTVNGIAL